MADFNTQMNEGMTSANAVKKLALVLLLVVAVAAIAGIWSWMQKPTLQLLYSNLEANDVGAVVGKLREASVPFELQGTSVFVPGDQVAALRMQMASAGLPQTSGVGYEIFDKSTMGTSEFVQKVNYRRALEGELSRTIGQISEVTKARVHLVVPERSVFLDRQASVRASVIIHLRPGAVLSPNQVQGIVHLVASSVEGLGPNSISVIDNHGKILTAPVDESSKTQMTSSQIDFQREIENGIEKKIQTMLERVVGPDKAIVRVASVLDLSRTEATAEEFNPEQQVPRSEQRTKEKGSGSATQPSGAPGVGSNVPGGAGAPAGGAASENNLEKSSEVINFEISKKVIRTVSPFGTIKKLSVAVLVDGTTKTEKDKEGKVTGVTYTERPAEEMKKLEELVKKAMGFDNEEQRKALGITSSKPREEQREDILNVVNVPFNRPEELPEEAAGALPSQFLANNWQSIAKYAVGLILAILILLLVVKPIISTLLEVPKPFGYQTVGQMQGAGGPGG
jgi:flagellar M-ring protein FliF